MRRMQASFGSLLTRDRWIEIARIVIAAGIILAFRQGLAPIPVLLAAVAFGLYPLVPTGIRDLIRERKVGTEIFVTVATTIAMIGHEYVAGSILMVIILIVEAAIIHLGPDIMVFLNSVKLLRVRIDLPGGRSARPLGADASG